MNCNKMEEKIYLYAELTASEKMVLNQHLNQCEACSQLARQVFGSLATIKNAASHIPELRNPQGFTQRILNAREKVSRPSLLSVLLDYLDGMVVRYAISVVSVILISFFAFEQQRADYSASGIVKSAVSKGTVLDYGKFKHAYVKQRDKKKSDSRYSYYKSFQVEKKL